MLNKSSRILVTAGLKDGIGMEAFLKSFLCLNSRNKEKIILYTHKSCFESNCKIIGINPNSIKIKKIFINEDLPQTLGSINRALNDISHNDILLTLPSSKNEFFYKDKFYSGHTEYFREVYNDSNIVMSFLSNDMNVLLLTDHIELKEVSNNITTKLINEKIEGFLNGISGIRSINKIYFSGINPHCGENGLMGDEDSIVSKSIIELRSKSQFSKIDLHGPIPGDTLFFEPHSKSKLFVYAYHDQGLAVFKQNNGLQGINLTLGLPFIRVSPDHGTAPDLYGKNKANYLGMNYLLNEIFKWMK